MWRNYRYRLGALSNGEVPSSAFLRGIDWRAAASGHLKPLLTPRREPPSGHTQSTALVECGAWLAVAEAAAAAAAAEKAAATP